MSGGGTTRTKTNPYARGPRLPQKRWHTGGRTEPLPLIISRILGGGGPGAAGFFIRQGVLQEGGEGSRARRDFQGAGQ